ncbi:baseplate J/gp47 family protein [Alicyclobacillus macrosporangiidus]|uniref:Uncharacterized phage protein gp47/JayE n=1 Tax=Alicyclobacillus macrosporangiidus TaxID=392015 RepID=A0A1I7IEH1_9BACL|nr:baseplate J/gp47 family protein [Alicyclobacillus macrosporangiidus]SFU71317.1 Uncharacterized phage protein gp47/JayE [Alicyclobacillus macrosporangiidus]
MAYFAPYIDATGIHIPTYQDIVNQLVADAQSIFGADIYLQPDSQDYQWISAFASIIYDSYLLAQAVYNSRGPATAVGSGLDVIVGINGLQRKPAVYSTCPVVLTGTPGTTITNGVVGDVNGNNWSLPTPVIIPSSGTITVQATCQTEGAIVANPGDINTIVTPTLGWSAVTNTVAATVGSPVETDAQLRARQVMSTAQPSQSILDGLKGAIAAIAGVTRFAVYENDTNATDANGLPPHSICCVVEGGTPQDIGNAIFTRKTPGCATVGSTSVQVTDSYGVATTIRYDVPTYVDIDVAITVKQLSGYTSDTTAAIQSAVADFLNGLPIGGDVYISSLWGAALSVNAALSSPTFSITSLQAAVHSQTLGTADIPIAYNQVARGNPSYVTVNFTS